MKKPNLELAHYLISILKDQYHSFLSSEAEPTAIRVNTLKSNLASVKEKLVNWRVPFRSHPINQHGLIIENDFLPLSHTLAFFKGEFLYQGLASQLPVLALAPQPNETILDMAASPGSKSTQIAALMNNTGKLVLNEVSARRLLPLVANISRAGTINDVVLNQPGQRLGNLFPEFFDRVLLDAPCSALGTLPSQFDEISRWWSYRRLRRLANLQYQLLVSAIKACKPGGIIIYSTCSLCPEENELIIDRIVREYPVTIEKIPLLASGIFQTGIIDYQNQLLASPIKNAIRIYPQRHSMEGFFIVRLNKTAAIKINPFKKEKEFRPALPVQHQPVFEILKNLSICWGINLQFFELYHYLMGKKRIWLLPKDWQFIPDTNLIKAGLLLAEKGSLGWKLTNASVQLLNDRIRSAILKLDPKQLMKLFKAGWIELPGQKTGYYALTFNDEFIGVGSLVQGKLKIRLPHLFDLIL